MFDNLEELFCEDSLEQPSVLTSGLLTDLLDWPSFHSSTKSQTMDERCVDCNLESPSNDANLSNPVK